MSGDGKPPQHQYFGEDHYTRVYQHREPIKLSSLVLFFLISFVWAWGVPAYILLAPTITLGTAVCVLWLISDDHLRFERILKDQPKRGESKGDS